MSLLKANVPIAVLMLLTTSIQAETLRDPTRPGHGAIVIASTTTDNENQLVLNSVLKSGSASYAVINNKILSVGDRIQGVKITAINVSSVSLSDGRNLAMYQAITETKEN
ncbi:MULTISPECIES: MSHA biogenesis protein MshK [Shewanella]|nr:MULTISPECIES: MSHA biogenesis protein MshK [Shewanella]